MNENLSFFKNAMVGIAATAFSKTAMSPLERVKMMISHNTASQRYSYTGLFDFARQVYAVEGVRVFFRGNLVNISRTMPHAAINFAMFHHLRRSSAANSTDVHANALHDFVAGACAGVLTLLPLHPLDVTRVRFARVRKSGGDPRIRSLSAMARHVVREEGVLGLFGRPSLFFATASAVAVYRGVFFGAYQTAKGRLLPEMLQHNFFAHFVVGWGSASLAHWLSFPFDTIRRRLLMAGNSSDVLSMTETARRIFVNEGGLRSFFRGSGAAVMRGVSGAFMLAGFDLCRNVWLKVKR